MKSNLEGSSPEQRDTLRRETVNQVIEALTARGCNYVYINEGTGKFGGERSLADFAFGYRPKCYCLDGTDPDLKNRDDLKETMLRCLEGGKELTDVSRSR